jgi:hypothetical protein
MKKIVGEQREHMSNKLEARLRRFIQAQEALKETLEQEVVEKAKANPLERFILMEVDDGNRGIARDIQQGRRKAYAGEVGNWWAEEEKLGEDHYRIWIVYVPGDDQDG